MIGLTVKNIKIKKQRNFYLFELSFFLHLKFTLADQCTFIHDTDRFMWLVLIKIVRIYLNLHTPRKKDVFDAL